MPFTDNLPASGTKPWYTPFNTTWGHLKTFINGLETSIANIQLTPGPKGDKGDPGTPGTPGADGTNATITGATATGLPAGAAPTVTVGGTPSARTFEFGIPKGDKGDPGSGGGGGAVDSVNGKTGVVTLTLDDVVGDSSVTDGLIGVANSISSPTLTTVIQAADVTLQSTTASKNTSIQPGSMYLASGANRAQITAPAAGGTNIVVGMPDRSGTIALAADLDNTYVVATDAQSDATAALAGLATKADTSSVVPNTRTVAGKPLSANVTLAKADVGLGSVDNTSDAGKPVSTAQQAALDAKVPTTRTVAGKPLSADVTLAKADVGLSLVDNTSDANKPVSTAQATAINAKVSTSAVATLGNIGWLRGAPITNGGTVPAGAVPFDIIIEAAP